MASIKQGSAKANAGASAGKNVSWSAGLTGADYEGLEIVEDNTEQVIAALETAYAKALEAIGIQAERDAARICPVDTGRLRNSITHTIEGGNDPAAIIGTNVEYAQYVHNGVRGRQGQPFLTDAVRNNADKYRKIAESALKGA